ncbi:MAG: hypothetical protein ACW98X_26450 [Promethearchaeota archaeon]
MLILVLAIGCKSQANEAMSGADLLSKKLFYNAPMTVITHITHGNLSPQTGNEIGIFGQLGLHILNTKTKEPISKVKFDLPSGIWKPSILYIEEGKIFEIVLRNGAGYVGLLDQYGQVIWLYESKPNLIVNNMAVGDLNNDKESEFYVATNNGLIKLNNKGEEIWRQGEWAYDVEVYDPGNNELPYLITINHDSIVEFRNSHGTLVRNVKPPIDIYDIETINWPTPGNILTRYGSSLFVLNFEGEVILEYKLNKNIFMIRGTTIRLYNEIKPYLAVIAKFKSSSGKSMLCIFSPNGKLVYKELLNVTTGLSAIQTSSSKGEMLLVGNGPGKVYSYQAK